MLRSKNTILCLSAVSAGLLVSFIGALTGQAQAADEPAWAGMIYHSLLPEPVRQALFPYRMVAQNEVVAGLPRWFDHLFAQPYLYLFAAITVLLERWIPAIRQKLVSAHVLQDFIWFVGTIFLNLTLLAAWFGMLSLFYDRHLSFLTLEALQAWPLWLRVVLSVLTFDLFLWVGHFIRHRARFFWCFHLVHHSQRRLNFFTEDRFHFVDGLMSSAVRFIPMKMVGVDFANIVLLAVLMSWYTRLYHGNIRSNFGLLKYILVTPQSHRIHHSIEERHWGKNLGTYFTIWDRLFGTLHPDYDEYPQTGIPDRDFPYEASCNPFRSAVNFGRQTMYPFRLLCRRQTELLGAYSPAQADSSLPVRSS